MSEGPENPETVCNRRAKTRSDGRRWVPIVLNSQVRSQFIKLLFDPGDLAAQPAGEGFYRCGTQGELEEIINGFPLFIEGDKPAGRVLILQFFRNELHQKTLTARMRPSRVT